MIKKLTTFFKKYKIIAGLQWLIIFVLMVMQLEHLNSSHAHRYHEHDYAWKKHIHTENRDHADSRHSHSGYADDTHSHSGSDISVNYSYGPPIILGLNYNTDLEDVIDWLDNKIIGVEEKIDQHTSWFNSQHKDIFGE